MTNVTFAAILVARGLSLEEELLHRKAQRLALDAIREWVEEETNEAFLSGKLRMAREDEFPF